MKNGYKLTLLALALIFVIANFIIGTPHAHAAEAIVWKFQNEFPAADASNFITSKMWKEGIEKATKGQLTIKLFEPDAIVPALEMENAIKKGVLDSGLGPAYGPGLVIGGIVAAGFPGQFSYLEDEIKLIHEKGLIDIARKAYAEQNLYFLFSFTSQDRSTL